MMVGVMDKIGTFGMIRFCLGLFPEASQWATPVVLVLATISILYGAILAIGSRDIMRFIAYTSISHFGFIVLGIFAFTSQSLAGSTLYMLNHGLSTAALFVAGGLSDQAPRIARHQRVRRGCRRSPRCWPGCCCSPGCRRCRCPACRASSRSSWCWPARSAAIPRTRSISTLAIVLAALYILIMYQRTMTGPVTPEVARDGHRRLNGRERLAMAPLVLLIVVLGVFPKPMLSIIEPAIAGHHAARRGH